MWWCVRGFHWHYRNKSLLSHSHWLHQIWTRSCWDISLDKRLKGITKVVEVVDNGWAYNMAIHPIVGESFQSVPEVEGTHPTNSAIPWSPRTVLFHSPCSRLQICEVFNPDLELNLSQQSNMSVSFLFTGVATDVKQWQLPAACLMWTAHFPISATALNEHPPNKSWEGIYSNKGSWLGGRAAVNLWLDSKRIGNCFSGISNTEHQVCQHKTERKERGFGTIAKAD